MLKDNPRILNEDIYRYIANNSSLTQKQVSECFAVYKDMLEKIFFSEYIEDNISVAMPNIGNFKLIKTNGRKKGTSYIMPYVDENGNRTSKNIVLSEDELDSYRLSFKVSKTLNYKIKECRKQYQNKQ